MKLPTENQRVQRSHLTRFQKHFAEFPQGDLEFGDEPDLVVIAATRRVGIEHTRLFRKDHTKHIVRQEQESLEDRIVARAREMYLQSGFPLRQVTVAFTSHLRLGKKDVDSIATSLLVIVSRHAPRIEDHIMLEAGQLIRQPFPREISTIFIDHVDRQNQMWWSVARGDAVPSLFSAQVEEIIQRKEARRKQYLQRCSEIWLLIVLDGSVPSSNFEVPGAVVDRIYRTDFDRVFLMENFGGQVIELKIEFLERVVESAF